MHIKRNYVAPREFDRLIRKALARAYASRDEFDNESDFKFELYHQLHQLEMNGHRLGDRMPGHPTCPLHVEAKAENGNPSKADLLVCNPANRKPFNYATEVVIELKETLNSKALRTEVDKFSKYTDPSIRKLYLISGNRTTLTENQKSAILSANPRVARKLTILDRSVIDTKPIGRRSSSRSKLSLSNRVAESICKTLNLYGRHRRQYHGFYWCNYEHEQNKGWTFPVEGDFNAQLYHRLRTDLAGGMTVLTEYRPSPAGRGRVDFFIKGSEESVGIEVKMNWDQLRHQPGKRLEAESILEKFHSLGNQQPNHTNILVVIQGHDGHKSDNKSEALKYLDGRGFSLLYYDERQNVPVGPVNM